MGHSDPKPEVNAPSSSANPRVSVCLPTYNGEAFLAQTLETILAQSFENFEVIIADDDSTDDTVGIVESFDDPRISLSHNSERLGLPGNWNKCLSLARGEYVCVFHQDDVMQPENLERKVALLGHDPTIGFVHSGVETIVEEGAPPAPSEWVENSASDTIFDGTEYFRRLLLEGNLISAPSVVARRELFLEHGGFDEDLGFACDYALWLRMCVSHNVGFVSDALVGYRWHGENATHEFEFERGAKEVGEAARRALAVYRSDPGHADGAILSEALAALDAARIWEAELRQANVWLESQRVALADEVAAQATQTQELKGWITELEQSREWSEGQRTNWERHAEKLETRIEEMDSHIRELTSTVADRDVQISALRGRNDVLQANLGRLAASRFGRAGVFLKVVDPEVFADDPGVGS
ncbi:MAG: glycosyltransferase [Acidimicrobiia bacterium]